MGPSLLQRESKSLIRPRGTNDPNLTQYQSHGITGSGLYPRREFGTVTIRRDELFSHRVHESLLPWAITVVFFFSQEINGHSRVPQIPPLFLPPSLHLSHPLRFFSAPPFPVYLSSHKTTPAHQRTAQNSRSRPAPPAFLPQTKGAKPRDRG